MSRVRDGAVVREAEAGYIRLIDVVRRRRRIKPEESPTANI
jgi:hypothetical protein